MWNHYDNLKLTGKEITREQQSTQKYIVNLLKSDSQDVTVC